MELLDEKQSAFLNEERRILNNLRVTLVEFGATPEDQQTLAESVQQLDELFLLVIVGEFNAGKSAFINALLGQRLLKEGVTPTTTQINVLRYGEQVDRQIVDENLHTITLPADLLREISIVDTPGTNAIIREHERITSQFVPRSDLVLFITSADRPFTESERAFLEKIRDWGKKVVLVLNKTDILQNDEERGQIVDFIAANARALLGITPEIFPISARLALRAKTGEPDLWEASRFGALESYIHDTLDEKGRLRLKLQSPLGVGAHLTSRYLEVTESRLGLLKDDFVMLADVEAQLKVYEEDLRRDFNFRLADIDNILLEMENRGQTFFDETFRFGRVLDLLGKDRIRHEFEHQVVADIPQQVEQKVAEVIDWLVDADLRQWQAVTEHLAERRREHAKRIVGDQTIGTFHYDRQRLIDAVGREAQRVVETFDKAEESRAIAESAQNAVATSLAVEVGAVGLGTLVTILATTAAADVTGILAAGIVAALGLFIIPTRRTQAKARLSEKVADLRERLVSSLRQQFDRELERSLHGINEAIAPYTRFVRAERGKLEQMQQELQTIHGGIDRLRQQLDDL